MGDSYRSDESLSSINVRAATCFGNDSNSMDMASQIRQIAQTLEYQAHDKF